LDTESLRLFVHLARSLHFGRTSRECHISPSALSRSIQRLEQEAGGPLFQRDSRHVELTAAGTLLLTFASETLSRWEQTLIELHRSGQALQGTLSLFCTVTAAHSLLPELLGAFRRAHPEVTIKLETGHAADALQALSQGQAEVAVAPLPDRVPAQLETRIIAHTPLCFVAPTHAAAVNALVEARVIPWGEVPMILPEHGIVRDRVERWFKQKRAVPKIYSEVSGHEAILSLVTLGCGVGVVPQLVLEKSPLASDVRVLDVRPRLPPFHVAVCIKQSGLKNPLVAAFWGSIADA
jgi:LysR family positive regulator for ilvC